MTQIVYRSIIYLCLLSSFAHLLVLSLGRKKKKVLHILLAGVVVITEAGFARLITAQEVETAIMANKFTYIGGCVLPLLVVRIAANICNVNLKNWHYRALEIISFIVLAAAWTPGYTDWYYKSVSLTDYDGITFMEKEYGPLHNLYTLFLGLYMLFSITFLIKVFKHKKNYSLKNVLLYVGSWGMVDVVYFAERLLHARHYWIPVAMALALSVFLHIYMNVTLYDIDSNMLSVYGGDLGNGYITVDRANRFTGCNENALSMYPELSSAKMDYDLKTLANTDFYRDIVKPLLIEKTDYLPVIKHGEARYKATRHPVKSIALENLVGYVIEIRDVTEEETYNEMVQNYQSFLEKEVVDKVKEMEGVRQAIVTGIAGMIESRDLSTGEHIRRTSDVVRVFTETLVKKEYVIEKEKIEKLIVAAPMHDIGKISVPDAVLRKQGKFTNEEYAAMKTHAEKGAESIRKILGDTDDKLLLSVAENVAFYHHEKWDGSGYPKGLKGEEIPVEARIMALADVFDALVSRRCYKEAFSYDQAFKIISDSIGSHFDPELGQLFVGMRPELEALYNAYAEEADSTVERRA